MESQSTNPLSAPCIMVIFGASGDLTKRLLVPALYNLACDGLLSDNFAVLGTAMTPLTTETFRESMSSDDQGIRKFHTRKAFDEAAWDKLVNRFHYVTGGFDDIEDFRALRKQVAQLDAQYQAGGNILFYFATSPSFFGMLCSNLHQAGFKEGRGWKRIIVEKPFGTDLESARRLNEAVLAHWDESQIYRVDHYLGKETVQNLLAFRFSNGMFEPLWNKNFIDNIQFNVCEEVDIGMRGGYYDNSGVVRDMMQNHMFQMLAYLCMEPPASFGADAIRNEKAKLLTSVRVYAPEDVPKYFVRGQYGPSLNKNGTVKPGYRDTPDVNPQSHTETFAAGKLHIDNWRWENVPIYLRSGKALWKRGTEIVVEFKKAPYALFHGTPVEKLASNRLVFHIQPYQGIELLFQAKVPGPLLGLQKVDMRFSYGDAFNASRYTGYEVMIYSCTNGDATLFSRGDLVEAAWKIAQPILDYWKTTSAPEFPNYARGSWGPKVASELIKRDGRSWFEVVTPDVLERSLLFHGADALLLNSAIMALRTDTAAEGEIIIQEGDLAEEMYLICHGEVEVLDDKGQVIRTLMDGDFFGEIGLLISAPRTATVRAKMPSDLFVLEKADFSRILHHHPQFIETMVNVAKERYHLEISREQLMA
ncbi:MAG: glucose-6-phosphate dehydrogenase [Gallionellaceae bacterium]